MKAAEPVFWALATIWRASVVFPDDSGPYISMILPRGTPPIPSAKSRDGAPVGIAATSTLFTSPSFIIDPSPKRSLISLTVSSSIASLFSDSLDIQFIFTNYEYASLYEYTNYKFHAFVYSYRFVIRKEYQSFGANTTSLTIPGLSANTFSSFPFTRMNV